MNAIAFVRTQNESKSPNDSLGNYYVPLANIFGNEIRTGTFVQSLSIE